MRWHRLEGELENVRGVEEAAPLRKRTADIREQLKFLLEAEDKNTVFWLERRGGRQGAAPPGGTVRLRCLIQNY